MAYMGKESKAKIVALAKPILKKYGMKGTFSVKDHSTIKLTLKSGKLDLFGNYFNKRSHDPVHGKPVGSMDINPYWYHEHFDGKVKDFFTEIMGAMKGADWFDKTDIRIDYFHTAYYISITAGTWEKPYILLK